MDQDYAYDYRRDEAPVTVAAPHDWDGIGQALRAAFHDYRVTPTDMTDALRSLERID